MAAALAPSLTLLLATFRGQLSLATEVLAYLVTGIAVALVARVAAAQPIAEADRMRTVLLATVSHDLRTPLAAAKAAVTCLRTADLRLTAKDQDELLATAEESLDLLTHLTANLLDVSRLQAGTAPVFARPAALEEITAHSLAGLRPPPRSVIVSIPPSLPQVMADPAIMERVIANLTANALRHSPDGSAGAADRQRRRRPG